MPKSKLKRWKLIDAFEAAPKMNGRTVNGKSISSRIIRGKTIKDALKTLPEYYKVNRLFVKPYNGDKDVIYVAAYTYNPNKVIYPVCNQCEVLNCTGHVVGNELMFYCLFVRD